MAGAPAALECRLVQVVDLLGKGNHMVLGEVVGIHLRDDCLVEGRFEITRYRPLTRLGYRDYGVISESFAMSRPGED